MPTLGTVIMASQRRDSIMTGWLTIARQSLCKGCSHYYCCDARAIRNYVHSARSHDVAANYNARIVTGVVLSRLERMYGSFYVGMEGQVWCRHYRVWEVTGCLFWVLPKRSIPKPGRRRKYVIQRVVGH